MKRPFNKDEIDQLRTRLTPLQENRRLAWSGLIAVMYQQEDLPRDDWRARQALWNERRLYDAEITRLNRQIGGYQGRINSILGITKADLRAHKFNTKYEEKYRARESTR